jgi:hypothetical protein
MWKEAVVEKFKVLSWNLFGGTEEDANDVRVVGFPAEIQTATSRTQVKSITA